MRTTFLLLAALFAGCAQSLHHSASAAAGDRAEAPALVLGVYDSRVLAIAYYRSSAAAAELRAVTAEHERARAAGDAATMERLEREMRARQELAHRQGFGGAPIPEILARISDRIPELARDAGVDAIVAKGDLLWLHPDAPTVEVSLALAEAFDPDAETRRMLPEVLRQKPVPLDEIRDLKD